MTELASFLGRIRPPSTPVLIIRREALLHNLRTMQKLCDQAGVRLRAHGKMHKCSALGRLQVELGAIGLCCQTVGEAEAFVVGGIMDVLVTAPVPFWGAARLARLANSGARLSVVVDDENQVDHLEAAARESGALLHLLVDVDLGLHRAGCTPERAPTLARQIAASSYLRFDGLQAYLGHLQHEADLEKRQSADAIATERLKGLVAQLVDDGLRPNVVTGGGTGTYAYDLAAGVFNELQAGSYAVMDVEYAMCGAPDGGAWLFEPALFIAASVVSAQHKTHCTSDAGLKAVAVDGPSPHVVAGAAEGSTWRSMGDEHGAILDPVFLPDLQRARDRLDQAAIIERIDKDANAQSSNPPPRVGDLVWLQPGHCDPTINLYDAFLVADEDGTFGRWDIDARRVMK